MPSKLKIGIAIAVGVLLFTGLIVTLVLVLGGASSVQAGGVMELETGKYYRLDIEYEALGLTVRDNSTVVYVQEGLKLQILNSITVRNVSETEISFFGTGGGSLQPVCKVKKNVNNQWQLEDNAMVSTTKVPWKITYEELDPETTVTEIKFGQPANQDVTVFYANIYGPPLWLFGSETLHLAPVGSSVPIPLTLELGFTVEEVDGQQTIVNVTSVTSQSYSTDGNLNLEETLGINTSDFTVASITTISSLSSISTEAQ